MQIRRESSTRLLPADAEYNPAVAPFLRVTGLSRIVQSGRDQITLLDGLSFDIARGEKLCILGASGSGKSTLLEVLGALSSVPADTVNFDGMDLASLSHAGRARLRRDRIGFVFQGFNLIEHLTSVENVALPLRYARIRRAVAERRASERLRALGLGHRLTTRASRLSGGEKQRVAIARATVADPDLLLADEPTGSLDTLTGEVILDDLLTQGRSDRTLVMVTHNPAHAAAFDRTLTLNCGRLQ